MLKFRIQFSDEEMAMFFKKHCLSVKEHTFTKKVPAYHNREIDENYTTVCVVNPFNLKPVPLSVAFEKVILTKAKNILLDDISKLEVLEIFKKKQ